MIKALGGCLGARHRLCVRLFEPSFYPLAP